MKETLNQTNMKKLMLTMGLAAITAIGFGQTFYGNTTDDPISPKRYASNGDISFFQFPSTGSTLVCFGINDSYFCEDDNLDVTFAIKVKGDWVKYTIGLHPYNASEWAYRNIPINDEFIQDLIHGTEYVYQYTDAHCSVERGSGSLMGLTKAFIDANIPLKIETTEFVDPLEN